MKRNIESFSKLNNEIGGPKMKKIEALMFSTIICLILTLVLALPIKGICAEKKLYKICLAQFVTHPAMDETRRGFIEGMAEQGFKEGANVE
jgi:putative ABC transport system substrate-binding protein